MNILITKQDKDLINRLNKTNREDIKIWSIPNIIYPVGAIVIAIISNLLFNYNKSDLFSYINILLNGSLPLIAINQISSVGLHIFKYNKQKEHRFNLNTSGLRVKLFGMVIGIVILSVIFFAYQVISVPFENYILSIILIVISILLVAYSSWITKRLYLLQEDLIEKTFSSEIRDEARETHGNNW